MAVVVVALTVTEILMFILHGANLLLRITRTKNCIVWTLVTIWDLTPDYHHNYSSFLTLTPLKKIQLPLTASGLSEIKTRTSFSSLQHMRHKRPSLSVTTLAETGRRHILTVFCFVLVRLVPIECWCLPEAFSSPVTRIPHQSVQNRVNSRRDRKREHRHRPAVQGTGE